MSLRTRFTLFCTLLSAVVAALVGVLGYVSASDRLLAEVDRSLRTQTVALAADRDAAVAAAKAADRAPDLYPGPDLPGPGDEPEWQMIMRSVAPDGTVTPLAGATTTLPLPASARELAAAGEKGQKVTTEVTADGSTYRELVTALGGRKGALLVAVPIDRTHDELDGMAMEITRQGLTVTLIAAVLGFLIAQGITARLSRLTQLTEEISADGTVRGRVLTGGRDEVGRLSASFDRMLGRLVAAREAHERLVQDAAHDLRTPLTSLRTNTTVLNRADELAPDARERLLHDVQGETQELSGLVEELVDLALARGRAEPEEPVDLADVAREAARRVHRRTRRLVYVDADDCVVRGRPRGLERAVTNLLENAAKFDAAGEEPIRIQVRDGTVTVMDRGPGVAEADALRIFDRFHRSGITQDLPGSGLGLAIVRDVAESHGGTVFARARPGGGAEVGFSVHRDRVLGPAREEK
ncbi:ATP-binding protein [Streptomyces sp. NPDC091294]|uniref:sensor histidine kinase n=1 Tax=Streptomyces sp. NPDC091294 TaxID=3365992 RepID=UPI00381B512F